MAAYIQLSKLSAANLLYVGKGSEVQIRKSIQLFSLQYLSYYPTKPYAVGTKKNRLNETILLSTHNIGLEGQIRILKHAKRPLSRALGLI